jgi:hypothetical protein
MDLPAAVLIKPWFGPSVTQSSKSVQKKNENQQGKFKSVKEETKNALINLAYLSGMSVPILGSFDGSPVLMRTAWAWDLDCALITSNHMLCLPCPRRNTNYCYYSVILASSIAGPILSNILQDRGTGPM